MSTRPNRELVVFALGMLGGDVRIVGSEEIAVKCFLLYPESFSWVKYKDYPDKDIVRVALTDARKEKYGAWVAGRYAPSKLSVNSNKPDGWRLTETGLRWLNSQSEDYRSDGLGKTHRNRAKRQLQRVFQHPLWTEFKDSPDSFEPKIGDIADLMRCRVDASDRIWEKRVTDLKRIGSSQDVGEDFWKFLSRCMSGIENEN